jgi:hypothetical protein
VPKTVKEALDLNKKNGNTLWADVIAKEMKDVRVAFKSSLTGSLRLSAIRKYPAT